MFLDLFEVRQSQPGSWDAVFEQLHEALYKQAQEAVS